MPNAKVFSVLDANLTMGFGEYNWMKKAPFGRHRFKRLPFAVSSAAEVFQKCIAQRLEDLEGVVDIMDDILMWGENV